MALLFSSIRFHSSCDDIPIGWEGVVWHHLSIFFPRKWVRGYCRQRASSCVISNKLSHYFFLETLLRISVDGIIDWHFSMRIFLESSLPFFAIFKNSSVFVPFAGYDSRGFRPDGSHGGVQPLRVPLCRPFDWNIHQPPTPRRRFPPPSGLLSHPGRGGVTPLPGCCRPPGCCTPPGCCLLSGCCHFLGAVGGQDILAWKKHWDASKHRRNKSHKKHTQVEYVLNVKTKSTLFIIS